MPGLEEGSERLRHGDKEAQHSDVGHGKEIADRTGTADRTFLIDVVTDVDVALGHDAVIGRDDRFESNERLEVPDILFRGLDLRQFGFCVGFLHRDRLLGDRMVFAQRHPALRGHVGEGISGALRLPDPLWPAHIGRRAPAR